MDEVQLVDGDDDVPEASVGSDLLALVTSNSGQNKIDVFLEREIDYDVTYDPGTGEVRSTATVVLRNGAPAEGLPEAVIGNNDQGLPLGTNRVWLSLYTPLGLEEARLDGRRVGVEYGREFGTGGEPGYAVYGGFYTLPPGGSATLEFDLAGTVAPGGYGLWVHHQPLVNPDRVHVDVTTVPGWRFLRSSRVGVDEAGTTATFDVVALERSQWVWIGVEPTG